MDRELFKKLIDDSEPFTNAEKELLKIPDSSLVEKMNMIIFSRSIQPEFGKGMIGINHIPNNFLGVNLKTNDDLMDYIDRAQIDEHGLHYKYKFGNWVPVHLMEELGELIDILSRSFRPKERMGTDHRMYILEELVDCIIAINQFSSLLSCIYPYDVTVGQSYIDIYNLNGHVASPEKSIVADSIYTASKLQQAVSKFLLKSTTKDIDRRIRNFANELSFIIGYFSFADLEIQNAYFVKMNVGIQYVLFNKTDFGEEVRGYND